MNNFEEYVLDILSEDAYLIERVILRFSKKPRGERSAEVTKCYSDVVNYAKLLLNLLEEYKGKPPEKVQSEIVRNDLKEAVRYNRHFGASRICIRSWGKNALPAEIYSQILEKYEWLKIVLGNLAITLEDESNA